jgi:hypothetical protein
MQHSLDETAILVSWAARDELYRERAAREPAYGFSEGMVLAVRDARVREARAIGSRDLVARAVQWVPPVPVMGRVEWSRGR